MMTVMGRRSAILCFAALLAGCSREKPRPAAVGTPPRIETPRDDRPIIVAFGDSLTAGHGLAAGLSYADFLQKELDRRGRRYRVVNQGISGDTTSGGVARIDTALALSPKVVILELGANDGLRGLPVEATRANLAEMIGACRRSRAKVLLCGMTLPRNYGLDYIGRFEKIFSDLARRNGVALVPFFLEGVATTRGLMQDDGLHPTAEGNALVARNVLKYLEPLLD